MDKFWYIVHFSGYNSSNIIKLSDRLKNLLGEVNVFCPIVKERRYNGKKRIFYDVDIPLFFGYVFINSENDPSLEDWIEDKISDRGTFLTQGNDKVWAYITEDEMTRLKLDHKGLIDKEIILDSTLTIGDVVRFKSGSFANFTGKILLVIPNKNTVKILTEVFHKETVVEAPINSIERI